MLLHCHGSPARRRAGMHDRFSLPRCKRRLTTMVRRMPDAPDGNTRLDKHPQIACGPAGIRQLRNQRAGNFPQTLFRTPRYPERRSERHVSDDGQVPFPAHAIAIVTENRLQPDSADHLSAGNSRNVREMCRDAVTDSRSIRMKNAESRCRNRCASLLRVLYDTAHISHQFFSLCRLNKGLPVYVVALTNDSPPDDVTAASGPSFPQEPSERSPQKLHAAPRFRVGPETREESYYAGLVHIIALAIFFSAHARLSPLHGHE